jgi:hypothetical protein
VTSKFCISRDVSPRSVTPENLYATLNRELIPLVRALRARVNLGEVPPGGYTVDDDCNVLSIFCALTSASVLVTGNKNLLEIVGVDSSTEVELTVSGDDNIITVQSPTKSLVVLGDGNRISGAVSSVTNTGARNDFTGLQGAKGRGVSTQTTDGSGRITIPLTSVPSGLSVAPVVSLVGTTPADAYTRVRSVSSSSIQVEVRKDDGTAYAATSVSVSYIYECY